MVLAASRIVGRCHANDWPDRRNASVSRRPSPDCATQALDAEAVIHYGAPDPRYGSPVLRKTHRAPRLAARVYGRGLPGERAMASSSSLEPKPGAFCLLALFMAAVATACSGVQAISLIAAEPLIAAAAARRIADTPLRLLRIRPALPFRNAPANRA